MQHVSLLVELKIPDVTALTAANTLRRSLGYTQLKQLLRADYYGLELVAADPAAAAELAGELAERTNLFVNPNKHAYKVISGSPAASQETDGFTVAVLVTDPNDSSAEGILEALQNRLGYGAQVQGVTRGLLWTLVLDCASLEEAKELAREMVVTTSLDKGLLVNPHFQDYEIL